MESATQARLNPADLINAAIEVLVQARYELPSLSLFCRLAESVSERTQRHSMTLVQTRLSPQQCLELDALLIVASPAEWSPFGQLCQHAGSVTRANVGQVIERLHSLPTSINTEAVLAEPYRSQLSPGLSNCDRCVTLDIDDRFLSRYWTASVCHPTDWGVYCRHALECTVLFEVMAGIRAGELYGGHPGHDISVPRRALPPKWTIRRCATF